MRFKKAFPVRLNEKTISEVCENSHYLAEIIEEKLPTEECEKLLRDVINSNVPIASLITGLREILQEELDNPVWDRLIGGKSKKDGGS